MTDKPNYISTLICYNKTQAHEGKLPSEQFFNNEITRQFEDERERWFNTDEAATYLSITPNALRILVHRARVKYYKLGRRLKFKKSDLISILQPMEV